MLDTNVLEVPPCTNSPTQVAHSRPLHVAYFPLAESTRCTLGTSPALLVMRQCGRVASAHPRSVNKQPYVPALTGNRTCSEVQNCRHLAVTYASQCNVENPRLEGKLHFLSLHVLGGKLVAKQELLLQQSKTND